MSDYKSTFDANPNAVSLFVSEDGNIFLSKRHAESYKKTSKSDYKEVLRDEKVAPKKEEMKKINKPKSKNNK